MEAYIGIKYHEDYRNKTTIDKISFILESKGYKTVCMVGNINTEFKNPYNAQELMKLTFLKLQ